jgi:pimeloyl-ACP methyl ester carboxylesterase
VLIYDRRNCGASDVLIGGALSEQEEWAEDLYELLRHLGATPAYVGGSSAGCRVSYLLALRHPSAVKALLLTAVSGGEVAAQRLGYNYYGQFIEAAQKGGMQAVIETPFFAERIEQNPSNRARLLAMDPSEFCAIMARWQAFFTADKPVIGATEAELSTIDAPAIIMPGNDEVHPRAVGENLHRIIKRSELVPQLLTQDEIAACRDRRAGRSS